MRDQPQTVAVLDALPGPGTTHALFSPSALLLLAGITHNTLKSPAPGWCRFEGLHNQP